MCVCVCVPPACCVSVPPVYCMRFSLSASISTLAAAAASGRKKNILFLSLFSCWFHTGGLNQNLTDSAHTSPDVFVSLFGFESTHRHLWPQSLQIEPALEPKAGGCVGSLCTVSTVCSHCEVDPLCHCAGRINCLSQCITTVVRNTTLPPTVCTNTHGVA